MKKIKQPKQVILAWTLTAVYAMFWLLWATHHICLHDHHLEKKTCHHGPNEKHFHSKEYANDACSLCQFLPANAEYSRFEFSLEIAPSAFFDLQFQEISLPALSPLTLSQPRAPPVSIIG
jgi:hypothetical protein